MNALEVIKQAATEMGIPIPITAASAADVQARQLFGLYNALGQELLSQYHWQAQQRTYNFVTVMGQSLYPLPDDWGGLLDQTQWDKTNHWPISGQATPRQWSYLTGGFVAQGPRTVYRIRDNQFEIFPAGNVNGFHYSFEYLSNGWCYSPGTPDLRKPLATNDDDVALFPDRLMVNGVKLKFFEIKGFNTSSLQKDYDTTLSTALGRDQGAQVLSLSPRVSNIYIGVQNVPDGSWPV